MPQLTPFEPHACDCDLGECRTNVLPLMNEMSRIANATSDLSETLQILLDVLKSHMNVVRAMISLFEPGSGDIFIHKSFGLTEEEEAKGLYFLGEGVTGRVVETGQPIVAPKISEEPAFLNRTGSRTGELDRKVSFICVPITRGKRVLGTISAERLYDNARLLRLDVEVLSMLATLTAQSAELYLIENVEKVALENENRRLRSALKARFKPSNIIGSSKPMQEVYQLIDRVTRTKTTVLILGESGVGKELVASAIHFNSPLSKGPFVKFNCAALPESVIESELFGHEKGSFTGAVGARKGRFEEANGGTVFLDEVGELSLPVQAKLLRVLQERSFERVGGNMPIRVNLRVLAATNRDLAEMVDKGTFREDLYYRLNVFPITIPPLRDRCNDIVALADHFVARFSDELGMEVKRISTSAINMLLSYHWPGNVRELENVIERAIILSDDGVIHGDNLPPSLQMPVLSEVECKGDLETRLNAVEYEMIIEALKVQKGNMTEAAKMLGLTRRILGLRMGKYKLNHKDFH
ncbi:sigma-54-dependent Fis family transcriptional regulator [Methylocystis bryophila]|uniref:Sigma-54-dependent Fis family transcriptional regulator n=2 Tax=Methylocystis bryophila TaxID=655015 RepID=A0A1W6N0N9_9HYPH|nr:sigma 54-interacting transcriptional regulator [Methylocystis bryophila]ARN83444.1 sigma-54-dependent Fis family transcriptional regulator [Methylocystis bryophila]